MAIEFPADPAAQSPANEFSPTSTPLASPNDVSYTWDGEKWVAYALGDAGKYVRIEGDTMTGNLQLPGGGGDTAALQKQEIDLLIAAGGGSTPTDLYWTRTSNTLAPTIDTDSIEIGATPNITLGADGVYTLAGGERLYSSAAAGFALDAGSSQKIALITGSAGNRLEYSETGDLTFNFYVEGNPVPISTNISLFATGSADFDGDVFVGETAEVFPGSPVTRTTFYKNGSAIFYRDFAGQDTYGKVIINGSLNDGRRALFQGVRSEDGLVGSNESLCLSADGNAYLESGLQIGGTIVDGVLPAVSPTITADATGTITALNSMALGDGAANTAKILLNGGSVGQLFIRSNVADSVLISRTADPGTYTFKIGGQGEIYASTGKFYVDSLGGLYLGDPNLSTTSNRRVSLNNDGSSIFSSSSQIGLGNIKGVLDQGIYWEHTGTGRIVRDATTSSYISCHQTGYSTPKIALNCDGTIDAANVFFSLEADDPSKYVATTDVDGNETLSYTGATLDVKDRLQKADAALLALKDAAAAATDFASLQAAIVTALAEV